MCSAIGCQNEGGEKCGWCTGGGGSYCADHLSECVTCGEFACHLHIGYDHRCPEHTNVLEELPY